MTMTLNIWTKKKIMTVKWHWNWLFAMNEIKMKWKMNGHFGMNDMT